MVSIKLITALVCAVILTFGAKTLLQTNVQQNDDISKWGQRNSLRAIAERSKAEGKTSVKLPGDHIDYSGVNMGLDEAVEQYSVVIAKPVEQKSYVVDSDSIRTWYKFRIEEIVSSKPYSIALRVHRPQIPLRI